MAKEIPMVAFRSRKVDPEAERAFIESGVVAPDGPKLTVVAPAAPEPLDVPVVLHDAPPDAVVESQESAAPEVIRVAAKRASSKKVRSMRQILVRADGRELRKRTIYVPVEMSRALDVACAQLQCDVSDVACEALEKWLAKNVADQK